MNKLVLIGLTVLVLISFSNAKPILFGGVGGGISRYLDANSLPKCIGVNCGVGFYIPKKIGLTFGYDFDYYFPFKTTDEIGEYHVNYHDFFISCNLLFLKKTNIQVGIGTSFINGHIEFLRDVIIYEFHHDSVYYHKGDVCELGDIFGFSCKVSIWREIPGLGDHLHLYGGIKAKSRPYMFFRVTADNYGYSSPHLPFHLSLGLVYRL
jgi:hypothetical protein